MHHHRLPPYICPREASTWVLIDNVLLLSSLLRACKHLCNTLCIWECYLYKRPFWGQNPFCPLVMWCGQQFPMMSVLWRPQQWAAAKSDGKRRTKTLHEGNECNEYGSLQEILTYQGWAQSIFSRSDCKYAKSVYWRVCCMWHIPTHLSRESGSSEGNFSGTSKACER